MISTFSRTNSRAMSAKRSVRPSAHRYSIAMVRPSTQLISGSRCTKAESRCPSPDAEAQLAPRNPMVGSLPGCCARAVSGHAAAPLSSDRNSRRLMSRLPPPQSAWLSSAACIFSREQVLGAILNRSEVKGVGRRRPQCPVWVIRVGPTRRRGCGMSALPPIATELVRLGELTRCAKRRPRMNCDDSAEGGPRIARVRRPPGAAWARRAIHPGVVRCRIAAQRAAGAVLNQRTRMSLGPSIAMMGRCPLHAGGRYALSCLPYDVFDADLGERRSNGRPSSVRPSSVLCESQRRLLSVYG
jgi:hypothetical protein